MFPRGSCDSPKIRKLALAEYYIFDVADGLGFQTLRLFFTFYGAQESWFPAHDDTQYLIH